MFFESLFTKNFKFFRIEKSKKQTEFNLHNKKSKIESDFLIIFIINNFMT